MKKNVNHPGFHRRQTELLIQKGIDLKLCERQAQAHHESLMLIKIAKVVKGNPLLADELLKAISTIRLSCY